MVFRVVKSFLYNNPDSLIEGFKLNLKQLMQRALPSIIINFLFKRKLKVVGVAIILSWAGAVTPLATVN